MTERERREARDVPTVDRLRHDIDSGRTGEKVDWPDPAAAPLGTDAEAGGAPPGEAALAVEAQRPVAGEASPSAHRDAVSWPYWLAAAAIGLILAVAIGYLA